MNKKTYKQIINMVYDYNYVKFNEIVDTVFYSKKRNKYGIVVLEKLRPNFESTFYLNYFHVEQYLNGIIYRKVLVEKL